MSEHLAERARLLPTDVARILHEEDAQVQRIAMSVFVAVLDSWERNGVEFDPVTFDEVVGPVMVNVIAVVKVLRGKA